MLQWVDEKEDGQRSSEARCHMDPPGTGSRVSRGPVPHVDFALPVRQEGEPPAPERKPGGDATMRFMLVVKAIKKLEAGVLPTSQETIVTRKELCHADCS